MIEIESRFGQRGPSIEFFVLEIMRGDLLCPTGASSMEICVGNGNSTGDPDSKNVKVQWLVQKLKV